ncbi:MAG: RDD family protein [Chloroflexota bacterium]
MSDQYIIETPENISFGYDVAGIGSRFLATLIDTLIQGTVYVFLVVVFVLIQNTSVLLGLPRELVSLLPILLLITLFVVQFGYFLAFELFTGGQTPGKRLFGLRVIKENGYPLAPLDCIIRNLVRIIDFFPFAYGIGVIVMFLNDRAKRLGDFAAGTLVVKMRDEVKLSDLQRASTPSVYTPDLPGLEQLREADIELIESFLQRRGQLKDTGALAGTIARNIRARMNSPQVEEHATTISHEEFLKQVAAAYRKAHQKP